MSSCLQTETMIDEIKQTFKRRVKQHEWIDDRTTKYVFEKASWPLNFFGGVNSLHISYENDVFS